MRIKENRMQKIMRYGAMPILLFKAQLTSEEAERLAEKLRQHQYTTSLIVSPHEDTEMEYMRYASPKRMRLLKYGRLKILTILIALALCLTATAQKLNITKLSSIPTIPKSYIDTVKAIMLFSDTADIKDLSIPLQKSTTYHKVQGVFWMTGYIIRDGFPDVRFNETYLDMDKKPLKKSIIVWRTKVIN
jgi:hypothetical protein